MDADGTPHAGSADHDDAEVDGDLSAQPATSGDVEVNDEPARPTRKRRAARILREWAIVIVCAVLLAVVVRDFVAQTFYIPSGSMEQTLAIGDRILVNKLAYGLRIPFTHVWLTTSTPFTGATSSCSRGRRTRKASALALQSPIS